MTTTKTAAKFAWDETNSATAVTMYEAMIAENGVEHANADGLIEIAKAVGCASHVQVRSKLVNAKVYQKAAKPRKVGGGTSLRKAHYVRVIGKHAVDSEIVEDADDLASLESCKLETLDALAVMLGVKDEVVKSAE